jgi:predicted anti-sigma-YlaC factor YlaD
MLTCRHTSRLLSDRLERSLSRFERLCLNVHLLGCRPCRRFGQAIGWLHGALASAPSDFQLPPEARERIQFALEQAEREG